MNKIEKWNFVKRILIGVFLLLILMPLRVNAEILRSDADSANRIFLKSQSTDKRKNATAKKKYEEFLKRNSSKYKYFQILNCGEGKTPVLLVTNRLYDPYGKNAKTSDKCEAYNFVQGKVVYVGSFNCRATECIRYAHNRMYCRRVKSTEIYKVKGRRLIKKTTNVSLGADVKCVVFKRVHNDKEITITKHQAAAKVRKIFGKKHAYFCFDPLVHYCINN